MRANFCGGLQMRIVDDLQSDAVLIFVILISWMKMNTRTFVEPAFCSAVLCSVIT